MTEPLNHEGLMTAANVSDELGRRAAATALHYEARVKQLEDVLYAATKYIAECEGSWDMAGRFLVDARPL